MLQNSHLRPAESAIINKRMKSPSIITAPRLSPEAAARIMGVSPADTRWLKELANCNGSDLGRVRAFRRKTVNRTVKARPIHNARKKAAKK
jgi:hypothetical protein